MKTSASRPAARRLDGGSGFLKRRIAQTTDKRSLLYAIPGCKAKPPNCQDKSRDARSSSVDTYAKTTGFDILGACTLLTFDSVVPHHACIPMFEIVTMINESPCVILEADKRLNLFARHDQNRILPAIVYKPSA